MTVWLTGDTIIAKEGESVCIGRAGGAGGDNSEVEMRRFDGPPEDDELIREKSSVGGISSGCFRFRDDADDTGCGVEREVGLGRCCIEGGLAGVATVPHLDQGGGGGTC